MIAAMPDAMGLSAREVILPVVPMFHANAWPGPIRPMIGAKMVMPGLGRWTAPDLRTSTPRK